MRIFNFTISTQTLNGVVASDVLKDTIGNSNISQQVEMINTIGDSMAIVFVSDLIPGEEAQLTNIVAAHDGVPYPDEKQPQVVAFERTDSSGLPVFAQEKASGDFNTYISHNFCDSTSWSSPTDSSWELVPSEGKVLSVDKAEVQFHHDMDIGAQELVLEYHAWVAPGTTMAVQTIRFGHTNDLFALGNDHYHAPALPQIPTGLSTIVFNYAAKLRFYGSERLGSLYKLVAKEASDTEITGTYATIGMVASETDQ